MTAVEKPEKTSGTGSILEDLGGEGTRKKHAGGLEPSQFHLEYVRVSIYSIVFLSLAET